MEKFNWQSASQWIVGILLTVIVAQNHINNNQVTALLKEHSDKIGELQIKVAVIEQQIFSNDSKKKRLTCNIKQWLCVNNFLSKKKKFDAYDNEDDIPLFV